MSRNTAWRMFFTLLSIGLAVFFVVDRPPQLGLDLEGGTRVVLDLKPRPGQELTEETSSQTLELLRNRVDSLGVSEPNLQTSGIDRIIVELPGVSDPEEAVRVIGSTAQLTFHPVEAQLGVAQQPTVAPAPDTTQATAPASSLAPSTPPTTGAALADNDAAGEQVLGQATDTTAAPAPTEPATTTPAATPAPAAPTTTTTAPAAPLDLTQPVVLPDENGVQLQLGGSVLTGEGISDAIAQPPQSGNPAWYIQVDFRGDAARAWTQLTAQAACNPSGDPKRQVAIVLDQRVISHPEVDATDVQCNVGITGNQTIITGDFTEREARSLALLIRSGALPVDVEVASQQVLGPELGDSAIEASRNAVIIGGILTMIFLLYYYRLLGLIAAISLAAYGLISYAVLIGLSLTLTLPGIAGFVLAIGMAMDSNILVFERTKEDFASGRTLRSSAKSGFKNALSAIIDSQATTLLAAAVLFFLAVGEVKGFGVTLMVGVVVSVLTTLIITRALVEMFLATQWAKNHPRALGMYVGQKFRERLSTNPPNLMGVAKYFLAGSTLIVLIALSGIVFKGIDYGIEFSGGRLLEYSSQETIDVGEMRSAVTSLGFEEAVVQRSGADDITIRVPELTNDEVDRVKAEADRLGGGAEVLRDQTVGPTFGAELKRAAIIALLVGIATQLIYMAWRFHWTFGLGAVLAMVHDVLLVVGVFAWLDRPFDAVFLASLLTIIAYSINDAVVVFDRIREQRRRRSGEPFDRVVNDACAVTIPRTINTGLAGIFILGALLILGGSTLADFSLALLIGIITGVYSSVFVAAPIATALERWRPSTASKPTGAAARRASTKRVPGRAAVDTADRTENVDDEIEESDDITDTAPAPRSTRRPPPPRKKGKPKGSKRR